MPDNEPIPAEQDTNVPSNYQDYLAEKAFVLNHVPTIPAVKQKLIASATNPSTQFVQNVSDQVKEQYDKVSQPDMLNLSNTIAGFNADKINALTSIQPPETTTQQQSLDEPKMKELDAQEKGEKATEIKNWADVVGETVPTGTIIKIDDRFKSEDAAFLKQLQRLNPAWTGEYLQMQNNSDGSVVPKAYNVAAAFKNNPTSLVQELPGVAVMVDSKPIKDEDAQKWIADQIDKQKEKDTENIATGALEFGNYAPSDRLKDANIPIPAAKLLMKNADLFNNFKDELNSAEGGDVVSQKGQANVLARAIAKTYDFDKIPNQEAIDAVQNANGLKATQYAFTKRQDELAAKLKVIGESNIDQNQLAQYQALQAKMLSNPTAITEDDKKNYAMLTMAVNDAVAKSGAQNAQQIWLEYQNNNKQFADILKQTPQLLQGATTPEGANGVNILLKQQKGQYLINTLSNYFPDLKAAEDKQQEADKGGDILSLPKSLYKGIITGTQSMVKGASNLLGGDKFEADVAQGLSNKGDFESNTNFITPVRPTDTKSDLTNFWNGATNFVDKTAGQIGQMLPVIATTIASGGSSAAELTPFMLQGYHDTELQMRREGMPQNYAETAGLINAALTGITMKLGFMPAKILEGKIANIGMKELLDSKFSQQSVMDYLQKFAPTKGDARNAFMGAAQGLSMQIAQHVQNTEANKEFGTKLDTSQLTANNVFNNAVQMAGITYTLGTISRFNDKAAATQLALKYADENPVMFASALDNAKQQALATGRFDINRLNELQNNVSRFYLKQHGMPINMNGEQQVAAMNVLDKIASLKGQLENVDPEFKSAIETQIKDQQANLHAIAEDPKKAEAHNNTIVKPVMQALQQDGLFKEPAAPVVQGTPEEITRPIELSPENTDAEYKPQIRDDYFADKHFTPEERAAYDKLDEAGKNKMVDDKREQLAGQGKPPEVTHADFKEMADPREVYNKFKDGDKIEFNVNGETKKGEWKESRIIGEDGQKYQPINILNEKDGYIKKADEQVSGKETVPSVEDNNGGKIKSGFERNIESLINPETGLVATVRGMDIGQNEKDAFFKRIGLTEDDYNNLDDEGKQKIQNQWLKSDELKTALAKNENQETKLPNTKEEAGTTNASTDKVEPAASQPKTEEKTISIKGAELANKLRKLKSKPDKLQANIFGIPIAIYDGAIETVATAIEKGSKLAEAIQKGIAHIKSKGGKVDEEGFAKHIEDFAAGEKPRIKVQVGEGEAKTSGIAHEHTSEVRGEFGLGEYEKTHKTDEELNAQADAEIKKRYDAQKLVKDIEGGKHPTDVETIILKKYISSLEAKVEADPSDENIRELKRTVDATDKIGSEQGRALRARQGLEVRNDSLAGFFVNQMDASESDTLTPEQKAKNEQEYKDIKAANDEYQAKVDKLEAENAKLKADAEVKKEGSKKASFSKKTHEDYVKERKDIVEKMRADLLKVAKGGGSAMSTIPGLPQLEAIAPHVLKLVRSLAEEGVDKLSDVVSSVKDQLKDIIDLPEKDIHDIIAGKYNEKKLTKNDISAKVKDLRDEASLINKLESLENGIEPKTTKAKIARNKQITELRQKIKEHDVTKLSDAKKSIERQIEKLQEDLASGNYAPQQKTTPILEDENIKKNFPALHKEAMDARAKLLKLRQEREVRLMQDKYANRSKRERIADTIGEIANIPRTLMSSVDFSAPLRQGLIATVAHPKIAAGAAKTMFKQAFSQKAFDNWFHDLKASPDYDIMQKSGLYVADPHDPRLSVKEEAFMNNLAEKIPIIGRFVKGSERAYVGYLNKLRVDLFRDWTQAFENEGHTIQNSPDLYKGAASFINNTTGRGGITDMLERASPLLNSVFFSPRLIASRLNILGLSDIASVGNGFYGKLPKEIRIKALQDLGKFVGVGLSVLGLAKLAGAQTESDPRSSDFGKIKVGNTRYDVWGGFAQYVRFFTEMLSGETKSPATGTVTKLNGGGAFGRTRADVAVSFLRGKLSPIPSMAWDFAAGRNSVGQPVTVGDEALSHFTPLLYNDISEAYQSGGLPAAIPAALASTFGVGVQTYTPKPSKKKGRFAGRILPHRKR
jgi:hypothetical protein